MAINDNNTDIRLAAVKSLGQLGVAIPNISIPSVVKGLLTALRDEDDDVCSQAVSSLIQLNIATSDVVEGLLFALKSHNEDACTVAVRGLGQLGIATPNVVNGLLAALGKKNMSIRYEAVASLGELGVTTPRVIDALLMALKDKGSSIRTQAAESLGQLGTATPTVVERLISLLTDKNLQMRYYAVVSLGELKVKDESQLRRVLAALNRQLYDHELLTVFRTKDGTVRRHAAKALGYSINPQGSDDDKNGSEIFDVSNAALQSIRQLTQGRQLPGYRWIPLAERQQRRQRLFRAVYGVVLFIGVALTAFGLSYLAPDNRLLQTLTVLGGLIGIAAGLAQILGKTLRTPWDNSE